jgi:putative acetyltransferase
MATDAENPPNLILRRARADDARDVAALMSEPSVYAQTLQMPHASEAAWRERLVAMDKPGVELQLAAERDGRVVGLAGLHQAQPSPRRRHAAGLGITLAREAQGQGIGDAMMRALLRHADGWAGLLRIELTVYVDNARAIALYQRHGFEREGVLRGYGLRDGVYVDCVSMARWRDAPQRAQEGAR